VEIVILQGKFKDKIVMDLIVLHNKQSNNKKVQIKLQKNSIIMPKQQDHHSIMQLCNIKKYKNRYNKKNFKNSFIEFWVNKLKIKKKIMIKVI
jgi:hypothetical protein